MAGTFHALEWLRIVADTTFLVVGAVPMVLATLKLVFGRDNSKTA
jgi:nitric oxide reductase large subunit